jgi:7,8-dihydroneopterin aldolase/epimerase/oxygenase
MDKIVVSGMEFYGFHGVFPEETKLGQRFRADLTVELDLREAGRTDDLQHTVNYASLYHICKAIAEGKPYKLVEAVAEKIAEQVLKEFQQVNNCTVKLYKPDPPIPGHYQHVSVEIKRGRT